MKSQELSGYPGHKMQSLIHLHLSRVKRAFFQADGYRRFSTKQEKREQSLKNIK